MLMYATRQQKRIKVAVADATNTSLSSSSSSISSFALISSMLLLLLVARGVDSETVVKQIHVITRHGSRYPLVKDASNLQENTPGTLTPFGQKQMFDLGVWVKETYNYTGFFNVYVPWEVHLESSAFDRTLVSADSFALGAFDYKARDPNGESLLQQMPANIPVYSTDAQHDVYLRAYDKCETFHERLQDMYTSPEWTSLEQEHEALLTRLGQLESFTADVDETGKIPLTNLWNVFDSLHVAKTECALSGDGYMPTCLSLDNPADATALTDVEFQELETLTSLVEQMRYGPGQAGRLIGGPLLLKIMDRMSRSLAGNFFLYSAHYATILGVLSALGESFENEGTIPDYASALLLILQQDTETGLQRVQVVFKPDSRFLTPPQVVPLRLCAYETTCPLIKLEERFMDWSIEDWCDECNNRQAADCLRYWMEKDDDTETFDVNRSMTTGLVLGMGISLIVACFVCFFCYPTRVKSQGPMTTPPTTQSVPHITESTPDESENADDAKEQPVLT